MAVGLETDVLAAARSDFPRRKALRSAEADDLPPKGGLRAFLETIAPEKAAELLRKRGFGKSK